MAYASELTGVPEDDLVRLHYVRHGPEDLRAARTEPLIAHVYSDLPLGSVHRLVLVDVEFHEKPPANEVSVSRRCMTLPRVLTRGALLRTLGLDVYCRRAQDRCLVWHNGNSLHSQSVAPFDVEHGDFLRVAIPPWPTAPVHISTRACVSRIRQQPRRMDYANLRTHPTHEHEDGMTVIDSILSEPHLQASDPDPDHLELLQRSIATIPHTSDNCNMTGDRSIDLPADKVDGDHQIRRATMISIGQRNDQQPWNLHGQPPVVHEFYDIIFQAYLTQTAPLPTDAVIMTWYSDHVRRPHSGLGREVRLQADFSTWYHDLVMAWQEWVDPFSPLLFAVVHPSPADGDAEVLAHVILIQHVQVDHSSIMAALSDSADDPWHPRLLCLRVPTVLSHDLLTGYMDLDGLCNLSPPRHWCQTWQGTQDVTAWDQFHVDHGAYVVFSIQRDAPWMIPSPSVAPVENVNALEEDESSSLLQRSARFVLSLEEHIAPPKFTEVDCQRTIFVRNQLCLAPSFQPVLDQRHLRWHPATWEVLEHLPLWTDETIVGMTLYTDGSCFRSLQKAAAGVVLILHTPHGQRWGGYLSAPCIGEATAPRAEATALLLASLWMRQLLAWRTTAATWFEIAYDCDHTAKIAQGHQVPAHNLDISVVLRSVIQWLEVQMPSPLTWTHHRSHQQHPWNEAADTVCRHAMKAEEYTSSLDELLNVCTFSSQDLYPIQWMWLVEKSLRGDHDAPLLIGHQWRFDVASPFMTQPREELQPAVARRRPDISATSSCQQMTLRLATANVLTLSPSHEGTSGILGARAEALAEQFAQARLHVVGLQETRATTTGHRVLNHFHVLSGPATHRGRGGVQLWMRRSFSTPSGPIEIAPADLRILHATARRLVVRWTHPSIRLLFIVAHAPHEEDDDKLQTFWDATSAAIPAAYHSWHTILLADANSRVGGTPSSAIGPHHADAENLKGSHFHGWLVNHAMYLPQTFEECHEGDGHTWTHPTGGRARLDYIAVPNSIDQRRVRTWVASDIDLTVSRPDHECVCAEVILDYYAVDRRPRDERISQPVIAAKPDVEWSTDVHTHAAHLQNWLRAGNPCARKWRKEHLTPPTRALIEAKRHHRKRIAAIRHSKRLGMLRQIFSAWRSREAAADCRSWIKTCDQQEAWHLWAYADLAPRVVTAVRDDDRQFYESLAAHAGTESNKGTHALWKAIQHALPRWRCKSRSNLRCTGPTVADQLQHYDNIEAGHATTYENLLEVCHRHQHCMADELPVAVDLRALPSRIDIEMYGCRIKCDKASGIDSVAPAALKAACSQHSDTIHQLMLKIWILGAEPVQFKGGILHPIAKKEISHRIEGMRGIMLIDGLGKLVHSHLRRQFVPTLQRLRHPLQLGGFARCSTLFATQYVRSFTSLAASKHLSSAVIFVDISSAFHSMIREFIFQRAGPLHPRLAEVLTSAGFDIHAIDAKLNDGFEGARHIDPTVARLLQDSHCHTWYTLGQSNITHQTERGSRPGSPLADVAFNALMSLVLRDLQTQCDQHVPLQNAFCSLGMRALPVSWVDDLAVPVVALEASQLQPIVQWTLSTAVQICAQYGLTINLKKNKTEVVPAFRGAQAPECRKELFFDHFARIPLQDGQQQVQCVSHYEHLGTHYQSDGGIDAEVKHRVSRALQAHRQVRKPILMNKYLSPQTRLRLLEALILPVLLHGAGNWPLLTGAQLNRLSAPYLRWIRSITNNGFWSTDQLPDQHLLLDWSLPTIAQRLAKLRLLYAFHWMADAPRELHDCVTAGAALPDSWFSALRQAIRWANTIDPHFYVGNPMTDSTEHVCHWLATCQSRGPQQVRRIFRLALLQGKTIGVTMTLHYELRRAFLRGGAQPEIAVDQTMPMLPADGLECRLCDKVFASPQAFQAHAWCAHGEATAERLFMSSTTCPACWQCLWTVNRLQIHLRLSRRQPGGCYERLTWTMAPWQEAIPIDEGDAALLPRRLPARHVPHVLTQTAMQCSSREDADVIWLRAWRLEGMDFDYDSEWGRLCRALCDDALHRFTSLETFIWRLATLADGADLPDTRDGMGSWAVSLWWLEDMRYVRFPSVTIETFGRAFREVRQIVHQSPIGRLLCWKRRMDEAYQPTEAVQQNLAAVASDGREPICDPVLAQGALLAPILRSRFAMPSCRGVPMQIVDATHVVWILHLYSGRRRIGDCHWWLEHIGHKIWPGMHLKMLSLDTAVDPVVGNLASGTNYNLVLSLAQKGLIAGILTGPPCETWSAARNLELPGQEGPRPLRSACQPWTLPCRTGKELRQTTTGTQLLMNSWRLEVATVLNGGGSIMEHPWENQKEERASVWRTEVHERWIMQLPAAYRHYIEQFQFGSVGTKPTCLRALNLGHKDVVESALREGMELWRTRPSTKLMGKQRDGSFRTAAAKEYTSALRRSMTVALVQGLRQRFCSEGATSRAPHTR